MGDSEVTSLCLLVVVMLAAAVLILANVVTFWLTKLVGERRRAVARTTQEATASMSAIAEETLPGSGVLLAKVFGSLESYLFHDTIRVNLLYGRPGATHQELLRHGGLYADLYNEQFEGGRVQSRCRDGDILADGTVRVREPAPA